MSALDDVTIFIAIISEGGFSHAAKKLRLSNGLISRRIAQLEANLGVTLIKRTTRHIHLTREGEIFWEHAKRIQSEMDTAVNVISSLAKKPKGHIKLSAPVYFGRQFLMPILTKFLHTFHDIQVDLMLTNQRLDPLKESLDIVIRGTGYVQELKLKDSTLHSKLLNRQKIGLYAHPNYLAKYKLPVSLEELNDHLIIGYNDKAHLQEEVVWKGKNPANEEPFSLSLKTKFNCNDVESGLIACLASCGIAKFASLIVQDGLQSGRLVPILPQYDWGVLSTYAVYAHQHELPKRTRLLLDYLVAALNEK